MSEFVVSAKLTAKNEASAPLKQVQGDLRGVSDATRDLKPANDSASASMAGLSRAFAATAAAARAEKQALDGAANAARQKQNAVRGLGIQLGDFGTQVSAGINPVIALGQQLGQMALAAEGLGGKVGKFAAFLNGPWGAALQFAAIVTATLASKLIFSGKASDDAAKSTDIHKMSIKDLIKAINDEDAALRKQLMTGQEAEAHQVNLMLAKRDEIALRRRNTAALLEEALAQAKLSVATAGGSDAGGALLLQAQARVADLTRTLAEVKASLGQSEKDVRLARVSLINRFSEESTDPAKKAAGDLERALYRLRLEYEKGSESAADYARKQSIVRTEYAATIKAVQDAKKVVNNNQTGRMISASEAAAIVKGIGGQVNSGTRTNARQQQLYDAWIAAGKPRDNPVARPGTSAHERGAALDVQFAPGLNPAKLRAAFQEEGVTLTKVFAERGHWHIEWAGGAAQAAKSAREMTDAARDAAAAEKALNAEAKTVVEAFDPAAAALAKYNDTVSKLIDLQRAGKISFGQLVQYGQGARADLDQANAKISGDLARAIVPEDIDKRLSDSLQGFGVDLQTKWRIAGIEGGKAGAEAFARYGEDAAQAISQAIGGRVGGMLGDITALLGGSKNVDFRSFGKAGGILSLLTSQPPAGQPLDPISAGLQEVVSPIRSGFKSLLDTFKIGGDFEKTLGHVAGSAAVGSVVGPGIGSLFGAKGSSLGGSIGGALGEAAGQLLGKTLGKSLGSLASFAGPLGSIAGSVLGSVVGGLLKKTKTGSATITSVEGDASLSGNSSSMKQGASTAASGVQSALQQIADQLGGGVGSFGVSIGLKDGKYRVDTTGRGNVKVKKGALDFGQDAAAAQAAALRDAIADGAITGLSAAVQRAIGSSSNIDQALKEALKVQQVEDSLKDLGGTMNKQFRDFETQAKERVRIATQYGFDVVKIEELNAKERTELVDNILGSRVGSLKTLLDDLSYGDLFAGSITDQIKKLQDEAAKAKTDALAGVDGAADKLADLERSIIDKALEGFGTAGPEYGQARADAQSAAQQIIQAENDRIKAAQDATKETNATLGEIADQGAEQTALLRSINAGIGALGVSGGGGAVSTAFGSNLK